MKKNLLTRPQIALVLIGHIFEELDEYDVAELLRRLPGIRRNPPNSTRTLATLGNAMFPSRNSQTGHFQSFWNGWKAQ